MKKSKIRRKIRRAKERLEAERKQANLNALTKQFNRIDAEVASRSGRQNLPAEWRNGNSEGAADIFG